jgi:hypothetical protein
MNRHAMVGLGLLAVLVGCATTAPDGVGPVSAPLVVASVQPSAMPTMDLPASCDPQTAAFELFDDLGLGLAKARDRVVVRKCDELYVQVMGQPPKRLGFRTDDFAVNWLAPDAAYAVGVRYATRQSPGTPSRLIKRFVDGRADQVLYPDPVSRVWAPPDGETIAFLVDRQGAAPLEPRAEMKLLRVETGEVKEVGAFDVSGWVQWSPDGQRLMFTHRNSEVSLMASPSVERPGFSVAWTSWEAPVVNRIPGDAAIRYDLYHRGTAVWAPDSRGLLVFDQAPMTLSKPARLVTLDLDGNEVARPIVDGQGQPLYYFMPTDVYADTRLVFGYHGLLDTETGRAMPFDTKDLLRWSRVPGRLLRWRATPEGPILDTVAAPPL